MIEKLIDKGLSLGADFVDVFREETRRASFSFKDKKVESATAGIDFGHGIRMIKGDKILYVESSSEDFDHLSHLMSQLIETYGWESQKQQHISYNRAEFSPIHQNLQPAEKLGQKPKFEWCQKADSVARSLSPNIKQVSASAFDEQQQVTIVNSEGLWVEDTRNRCRFSVAVTAGKDKELTTGSESPGAMSGMEFFQNLDIEYFARQAGERALRMLDAGYIEGGKMPVILGPGFGGVIFHEACGHPLETESVRKKASPFTDKLGEMIAHPCLTAIDDGTVPNSWGSIHVDDEGMPTEKTTLIENGVLKTFLSDRIGAQQVGVKRSASARRESFRYAPVSRMRNTYIDSGNDHFEDMLQSVGNGFYAKVLGGGSVNPSTGEFNFSVQEGYRVKDGKIAEPLRGATLLGKGHEVMPKISMVGDDLSLAAGMCGASSGSVPVTVGQPHLKVDDILVGGR
jgi:TldD protein